MPLPACQQASEYHRAKGSRKGDLLPSSAVVSVNWWQQQDAAKATVLVPEHQQVT